MLLAPSRCRSGYLLCARNARRQVLARTLSRSFAARGKLLFALFRSKRSLPALRAPRFSRLRTKFRPNSLPQLLDAGLRVVDLSGAFRFRVRGNFHLLVQASRAACRARCREAVYGLPELYSGEIANPRNSSPIPAATPRASFSLFARSPMRLDRS